MLHAPLPFLIGVDSRFFDLYDPPPDVSCIDLDTNIITVAENQRATLNVKLLPKKPAKVLKAALDYLYYQIRNSPPETTTTTAPPPTYDNIENEFRRKEKEQALELEIQEAFLRFMALTLKDYRSFLLPITKAPTVGTTDPQVPIVSVNFFFLLLSIHIRFMSIFLGVSLTFAGSVSTERFPAQPR